MNLKTSRPSRRRATVADPEKLSNPQHQRFIETARALECDEDKGRFEKKLGQIAKAKPIRKPKPAKK
jgi:hypothetical protein